MPKSQVAAAIVFFGLFSSLNAYAGTKPTQQKQSHHVAIEDIKALHRYAQKHGYSDRYGLFANLALHSGQKRLTIIDFQTGSALDTALVTHGHCKEDESNVRFSNTPESNCSSAGKYSIGKSYFGRFGLAFKLHGLDATNSNAYSRAIVLHAHECVDDKIWPIEICESEGCPTVSPNILKKIQTWVQSETKLILLWIYKKG